MTSTIANAKFEGMTKEEKLRFCEDLIRQAADLTQPNQSSSKDTSYGTSGIRSLSKRSPSSIKSRHGTKKVKSNTKSSAVSKSRKTSKSKSKIRSSNVQQKGSTSSVKSSVSKSSTRSAKSKRSSSGTRTNDKSSTKQPSSSAARSKSRTGRTGQKNSKSSVRTSQLSKTGNISDTSPQSKTKLSHAALKSSKSDASKVELRSLASKNGVQSSTTLATFQKYGTKRKTDNKSRSKARSTDKFGDAHAKSTTMPTKSTSISKARSGSKSKGLSKVHTATSTKGRSTAKGKSGTKAKIAEKLSTSSQVTSGTRNAIRTVSASGMKSKTKHGTKKNIGTRTRRSGHLVETCQTQFVPKFNPSSNKNEVPVYHIIRHAFGNMVREAICQMDKDRNGISAQQIIDHILKHYKFSDNISENIIRNRALFTINAGLRSGTLLSVSPKSIKIGRMRRNYPRLLC